MIQPHETRIEAIGRAMELAEAALALCDEHALIYAAIDLSSAIEKLKALRQESVKD